MQFQRLVDKTHFVKSFNCFGIEGVMTCGLVSASQTSRRADVAEKIQLVKQTYVYLIL